MSLPTEPNLIDVDSPLHKRLQEMSVEKMKELIRLRTRRGIAQASLSNQQLPEPQQQPVESVDSS